MVITSMPQVFCRLSERVSMGIPQQGVRRAQADTLKPTLILLCHEVIVATLSKRFSDITGNHRAWTSPLTAARL